MELMKQKLLEFWQWIPKWQFYGAMGLAVVLWVVRRYSLATLVVLVAGFAWVLGFIVKHTDVAGGFGTTALGFAMIGGAAASILAWFLFIRKS